MVPCPLNGSIGVRQSTAVTLALKLLLEFDPDLAHLKEVEEGLVRLEEEDKRIEEDIRALQEKRGFEPVGKATENHDSGDDCQT